MKLKVARSLVACLEIAGFICANECVLTIYDEEAVGREIENIHER